MSEEEKVVARFKDGSLVKGYVRNFRVDAETVRLRTPKNRNEITVPVENLKALFFVKTFSGYREYVERKVFGIRKNAGRKVFVKFGDKESLLGFIEGAVPWNRGFSLTKPGMKAKGFFLVPVDSDSNNTKVFVVGSAISDITIMVV